MVAVSTLPYSYFLYKSIYVRFNFNFLVLCHTFIFVGQFPLFFFNFYLFIFGCAGAFSSCSEQGLLFDAVHGLLTAVGSLVVEHEF